MWIRLLMTESPKDCEYRGLGPALGPEAKGRRVDEFLARGFPFNSRRQWKEICRRGHLLVNGQRVRGSHKLKSGDVLQVYHPLDAEPPVDAGVELLLAASGVIALYKPGNLPMHECGLYRRKTLAAIVAERYGSEYFPVHRLDRETSGIVLCAATPFLRRQLSSDFETRKVDKRYLAIARGAPPWDQLTVDQPLRQEDNERRPRILVDPRGVAARTDFAVLGRKLGATLLEARPRTGRLNQIRAHAAWMGHPLLGDKIYHPDERVYDAYHRLGDTSEVRALAGFPRHALHAAEITVRHPETGRELRIESPLPADLRRLWDEAKPHQLGSTLGRQ